jgi:hypothetical protein
LIQECNGQTANLLKPLEIKDIVVHVGLFLPLKPCLIESVSSLTKLLKFIYLMNKWLDAFQMAAMVENQAMLGTTI